MTNIEKLAEKVIASCDASIAKCDEILATLKRMEERGEPEPAPKQVWRRDDDLGRVGYSRANPPTHWMPQQPEVQP